MLKKVLFIYNFFRESFLCSVMESKLNVQRSTKKWRLNIPAGQDEKKIERKRGGERGIHFSLHSPTVYTYSVLSVCVTLDRRKWQMASASLDCASFSAIFKYSKTIIGVKRVVAWFRGWLIISRFRFCDYAFDSYISVKKWIVSNF